MARRYIAAARKIFSDWYAHEAPRLGAALAFYTILSLSPLLVLAVAISGLLFDRTMVMREITSQIQALVGYGAAGAIQAALESAQNNPNHGMLATAISIVTLLLSASGVFGELRTVLNKMWDVKRDEGSGIVTLIREEIFSFGMVLAVGFLLLASLMISATLAAATTFLGGMFPLPTALAAALDLMISIAGVAAVFGLMSRYVPAVRISWRPALWGGLLTAVLFTAGKYLIGLYIAKASQLMELRAP
ncbi:MAG TPA: YihY/virulence factor BrkB family protein [Bryobacteraceae bacterium]|nr:YihY/virulence factor BrkB family protein [Bryobacteraceae bacterium]